MENISETNFEDLIALADYYGQVSRKDHSGEQANIISVRKQEYLCLPINLLFIYAPSFFSLYTRYTHR